VLKFIRRNAAAAWVKMMFLAIVVVFVFWGVGAVVKGDKVQVVARINDDVIEPTAYFRAYNNMLRFYQELYKDNLNPQLLQMLNLKSRTVDQLVQATLLRQEAGRIGLQTSENEVRDAIAEMAAFHRDGRFNHDRYVEVLRANGLTPGQFESLEREELLVQKLQDLILAGVHVSEAEVREQYRLQNEQVSLRFLELDADRLAPEVVVTSEQEQAYYDAHPDEFRAPERMRIEYVFYEAHHFAGGVHPTDEEIRAYYDAHVAQFTLPEQVRVRHILLRVEPGADAEATQAARARAEEVLAKVKAGEDFAALAKQYSQDSTAPQGGDLGAVTRGQMVKPFEDAAFALAAGETSEIVQSPFGFHIIKVESKQEARVPPLDEVREQIVVTLKREQSHARAENQAQQDREKVAGGASLADTAAAAGLSVVRPEPFARSEEIAGLGPQPQLIDAVAAAGPGEVGMVASGMGDFFVFRVIEKLPSTLPPLAEVQAKVEAAVRKQGAVELAKTRAEAALAEAQKAGMEAAAQAQHLTVEETGPFNRQAGSIPKIGVVPDLVKAAFRLTPEAPVAPAVYTVGSNAFVAALERRLPADEEKFESEKANLIRQVEERRKAQAMQHFVDHLKAQAKVEVDEVFVANVVETGRQMDGGGRR
jgi:peptidyl-prolyl cis-trans isomerase D